MINPVFQRWHEDRLFQAFIAEGQRQAVAMRKELIATPEGAALVAQ
jgi:hypothetical protein